MRNNPINSTAMPAITKPISAGVDRRRSRADRTIPHPASNHRMLATFMNFAEYQNRCVKGGVCDRRHRLNGPLTFNPMVSPRVRPIDFFYGG